MSTVDPAINGKEAEGVMQYFHPLMPLTSNLMPLTLTLALIHSLLASGWQHQQKDVIIDCITALQKAPLFLIRFSSDMRAIRTCI